MTYQPHQSEDATLKVAGAEQQDSRTLPEIGEEFLRDPALLELSGEPGEYTDDTAVKWAWFGHGYATGMTPFYSAQQLKDAMQAAFDAGVGLGRAGGAE